MNKALLVLNFILLAAVAVLFILYFGKDNKTTKTSEMRKDSVMETKQFRIAYFDMDTVENSFSLAKEMQAELNRKDESIAAEMNRLQSNYQQRLQKLNQEGPTMTQAQVEAAQREMFQMEQNIKNRKMQLDQEYQSYYVSKQQEIISLIREFCKDYNKSGKYSLIIANEPGLIYYKDTTFNITSDLMKGLHEMYKQKKSK